MSRGVGSESNEIKDDQILYQVPFVIFERKRWFSKHHRTLYSLLFYVSFLSRDTRKIKDPIHGNLIDEGLVWEDRRVNELLMGPHIPES